MIRLKLHIRKAGTLLQNIQRFSCNVVGMSCHRKIGAFTNDSATRGDAVPAAVVAPGHLEPFMITHVSSPNEPGRSHCISFAIAKVGWSVVSA